LRTYRRHVATLMDELGAGSRFEAGVKAMALGLVKAGDRRRAPTPVHGAAGGSPSPGSA
jgi:hypothetical protein